jgi:hypothetical protein
MLISEVPTAYRTVHTARSDQLFIHGCQNNIQDSAALVTSSRKGAERLAKLGFLRFPLPTEISPLYPPPPRFGLP